MGEYNCGVMELLFNEVGEASIGARKEVLLEQLKARFNLVRDRKVYSCKDFAIRVSSSESGSFSNTVLSLSTLEKYDTRPFIVILVTPNETNMYLANSTFLKKISHSSLKLRVDNIRGSFNGSDIMKVYNGVTNSSENFEELFAIHQAFTWDENLERLVEATNDIVPHKKRFEFNEDRTRECLMLSPNRACLFMNSKGFKQLRDDLIARTKRVENEIVIASFIDNVNLRGRIIEELITADDPRVIDGYKKALADGESLSVKTDQKLGDYSRAFQGFRTETDIKTKILFLQSAPKAFNVDKLLNFLSADDSVYLFYLVGIDKDNQILTRLVSVFEKKLLSSIVVQHHWAGRGSRGVTQFSGIALDELINGENDACDIDEAQAVAFLEKILAL